VTALVRPDVRLHRSWAAAVLEFGSEQIHGSGSWEVEEEHRGSTTHEACAHLVDVLRRRERELVPEGRVPCSYFWIVDDEPAPPGEVVGFIAVRHHLNEFLLAEGGHIGYSVRPSRRRQGHASRALELGLDHIAGLGVQRVLVTCDDANEGSRRTIERAGGVLEDVRGLRRRYWIALDDRPSPPAGGSVPRPR